MSSQNGLQSLLLCAPSRIVFVLDKIQSNLHKRFRLYICYERSAKLVMVTGLSGVQFGL